MPKKYNACKRNQVLNNKLYELIKHSPSFANIQYATVHAVSLVLYLDLIFIAADGLNHHYVKVGLENRLRLGAPDFWRKIRMQYSVMSHLVTNYLK